MSKKGKEKVDYKARLELKLYLARESPDPIFDLTECDLKQIPSGVFSLCRVFLKDTLLLGHNRIEKLNSGGLLSDLKLLVVLDLQNNNICFIPDGINSLFNLRELHLNDNHLKELPESITYLHRLCVLNLANNNLHKLPDTFGNLIELQEITLTGNKNLKKLPKSMSALKKLIRLSIDCDNMKYPPGNICEMGVEEILKFITEDCGVPYIPNLAFECENDNERRPSEKLQYSPDLLAFQEKLLQLEKLKELKQQQALKIEQSNEERQLQELKLQNERRANKQKFLEDLVRNQDLLEGALDKFQRERDLERQRLISNLIKDEQNTEACINQLLEACKKAQPISYEGDEITKLYTAHFENSALEKLKRQDILEGMHKILKEENERIENYLDSRNQIVQTILSEELTKNAQLDEVVKSQERNQQLLAQELQENNNLQMAAVGALMERSDTRTWSIIQQVQFVSSQLAKLTNIELDKRKLKMDSHLNDLSEQRMELTNVLLDLLHQQSERRNQLVSNLRKIHESDEGSQNDFWLLQYQKLCERMPESIEKIHRDIDPNLLERMLLAGILYLLPFLSFWAHSIKALVNVTDLDLEQAGIVNPSDRKSLLEVINEYVKNSDRNVEASAPSLQDEASAPPLESTINTIPTSECVICMDLNCTVVYIPCGHLCTCQECSRSVDNCPLCRGNIEKRVQVILA